MSDKLECGFDVENKTDADLFREMMDKCEIQNEQIETRDNLIQQFQTSERELLSKLAASEEARKKAEEELLAMVCSREYWYQRAEAAEGRIKASQEQEPIKADGKTYGTEGNYTFQTDVHVLYKQPPIPPELSEVVRERDELRRKLAKQSNLTDDAIYAAWHGAGVDIAGGNWKRFIEMLSKPHKD